MAKKALKVCLTQLIIIQIEKNFRFFLSIVDWFDSAKKPSHATVPLSHWLQGPITRVYGNREIVLSAVLPYWRETRMFVWVE